MNGEKGAQFYDQNFALSKANLLPTWPIDLGRSHHIPGLVDGQNCRQKHIEYVGYNKCQCQTSDNQKHKLQVLIHFSPICAPFSFKEQGSLLTNKKPSQTSEYQIQKSARAFKGCATLLLLSYLTKNPAQRGIVK